MKTIVLVDDLDPTRTKDVGTVEFSIRGKHYEVDLSAKSQSELDEALAPFIDAARPVRSFGSPRLSTAGKRTRQPSSSEASTIRSWANENGYNLGERGRIPANVRLAYLNRAAS